jgi:hypothetical protein
MAPPAKGGGILTKKIAGVPGWGWALGGLVVFGGAYYYEKKKKASAAAATAATPAASTAAGAATTGAATTPYGPSGGAGIDPGTLAAILSSQGAGSTAAANTTPGSQALATGETFTGSGYGISPSASGAQGVNATPSSTPVVSNSGVYYTEVSQAQLPALNAAGTAVYYQPVPGVFTPVPPGATENNLQGLVGNTPLFIQSGTTAAAA